jgi:hypothetical protein
MKTRISKIDNQTTVFLVEDGDSGPLVDAFDKFKNGYSIMSDDVPPFAVIDSRLLKEDWCTEDHLLAIEAHELGHIHGQTENEVLAEQTGIDLLLMSNLKKPADILLQRGIV